MILRCLCLPLLCALPLAAVEPPDEKLVDPEAVHLPNDELQEAAATAVGNGLVALIERMHAPDNDKHFAYPPVSFRQVVDYEEVERRYSYKQVKVPVYKDEYKEVERLVPVKDEYGGITGYEKRKFKVLAKRTKVGEKTERRLVSDPNGDVVRKQKRAIYGDGEIDRIPRGWWAINAMALAALHRGGLGDRSDVQQFGYHLMWMARQEGIPDHTYDLAWLAAAYAIVPGEEEQKFAKTLAGKLLDGTVGGRRGDATGLWGPVAIDMAVLARFFAIEIELAPKLAEVEEAMGSDNQRTKLAAQKAYKKFSTILNEVQEALDLVSFQGKRLMDITKSFSTERFQFPGLPYYIYNQAVADVDSTAVAALALRIAEAAETLPEQTPRSKPGGYTLVRAEKRGAILSAALAALRGLQLETGAFPAGTKVQVETSFDKLTLQDVPNPLKKIPGLHDALTWRSTVNGSAAFAHLMAFDSRAASRFEGDLTRAESKSVAVLEQMLALGLKPDLRNRTIYIKGDKQEGEPILKGRGYTPVPKKMDEPAVAEQPIGLIGRPYELLEGARALHWPATEGGDLQRIDLWRRVAYRLLLWQNEHGLWGKAKERRPYGMSQGDLFLARRTNEINRFKNFERAQISGKAKEPAAYSLDLDKDVVRRLSYSKTAVVDTDLFEAGTALHYLLDGLTIPVVVDAKVIDEALAELAAGFEEAANAEPDDKGKLPEADRNGSRSNDALWPLWAAIAERAGLELAIPESDPLAAPAAEGDAPAEAVEDATGEEAAPAEAATEAEAEPGAGLDDILKPLD